MIYLSFLADLRAIVSPTKPDIHSHFELQVNFYWSYFEEKPSEKAEQVLFQGRDAYSRHNTNLIDSYFLSLSE